MTSYLGADHGEHRRADAQTSGDSAGSSDTGHYRTEPLRDAALGEPRIRAGEIIGWRFWKLRDGLLYSVFIPHAWHPGVFERSSSKQSGFKNPGYRAFRDKEQAVREVSAHTYWTWTPFVIGSVAMWGEVIEHEHGWRSEFAAVRSIIDITGNISFGSKNWLLLELREKYRCAVVTELSEMKVRAAKQGWISLS